MKNKTINLKIIRTIVVIVIIISIFSVIRNMKNKSIVGQEIAKKQLGETTIDNAYVLMETHTSEVQEKEQKLVSFKSAIASAITEKGVETASNADETTMVNNIKSIPYSEGGAKYLGTARTYDLTSYSGYEKFTNNNFLCVCASFSKGLGNYPLDGSVGTNVTYYPPTISYNSSTGILTIGAGYLYMQLHEDGYLKYKVDHTGLTVQTYLIEGGIS